MTTILTHLTGMSAKRGEKQIYFPWSTDSGTDYSFVRPPLPYLILHLSRKAEKIQVFKGVVTSLELPESYVIHTPVV
jgi:hypothetical protein